MRILGGESWKLVGSGRRSGIMIWGGLKRGGGRRRRIDRGDGSDRSDGRKVCSRKKRGLI